MPRRSGSHGNINCHVCNLTFNHRSSLSRHLKLTCGRAQVGKHRQKSCSQCSRDKVRCSLSTPKCARCLAKGTQCRYPYREDIIQDSIDGQHREIQPRLDMNNVTGHLDTTTPLPSGDDGLSLDLEVFSLAELPPTITSGACNDSVDSLSGNTTQAPLSDELSTMVTSVDNNYFSFGPSNMFAAYGPGTQLVYSSMELILRVLRSWPGMLAEGFQIPPLFHHSQLPAAHHENTTSCPINPQLAKCITITKMWHGQQAGAEQLVNDTILREVDFLLDGFIGGDEDTQLHSLQSLVIYTILILSPSKEWRSAHSIDTTLFARIKRTVQTIMGEDLFPRLERNARVGSGLQWDAWIHLTAKRRAVLALYLLHWAYSMYHGVQSFDCREVNFMPAPAPRVLWQARTEAEWSYLYQRWLERWKGGIFLQGEFMTVNTGVVLGERAERYLQEADEFGFIMMAIVNATDFQQGITL